MKPYFKFGIWYFSNQICTNQRSYWFCINYKKLSFAGHWQLAFYPDSHVITKLNTCQCVVSFASKVEYGLGYLCSMHFWNPVYSSHYGIIRIVIFLLWNVSCGLLCLNVCFLAGDTSLGDCGTFGTRVLPIINKPLVNTLLLVCN